MTDDRYSEEAQAYLETLEARGRFIPRDTGNPRVAAIHTLLDTVQEWETQETRRWEYQSGVLLNDAARRLLAALDRETSIEWENVAEKSHNDWADACQAVAILSRSGLCEASRSRLRISTYACEWLKRLTSEPAPSEEAGNSEAMPVQRNHLGHSQECGLGHIPYPLASCSCHHYLAKIAQVLENELGITSDLAARVASAVVQPENTEGR